MADDVTQAPGAPLRELGDAAIPYETLRYIPRESAEHYRIAPLGIADGVLEVGMVEPEDLQGIDAINFIARATGVPYKIFKISSADMDRVLGMYGGLSGTVDRAVSDFAIEQSTGDEKEEHAAEAAIMAETAPLDLGDVTAGNAPLASSHAITEDAPAIKLVSTILRYAIDGRASDVHIEPQTSGVRVRYRVDGDLHTSVVLPRNTQRALIARVKVLASIRLDEQRKPQDGRFSATIDGRQIDFRVSTFPSYNGEKVVIRILDRDKGYIPLDQIGLTKKNLDTMRRAVQKPHGLILISGPTGSGKSTTLYSMLSEVDRETKNVLSLEDPIEYYVDGVTQSQVRPEIGYTFANGLRTTLRQDPDVIMVGEIRDGETAKLAIQAALTGHLVLSTIHTNDAVGTIPRLIDMGVEPYLIPPVLICSIAQRLVRTFSPGGAKPRPISESERRDAGLQLETLPEQYRFPIPDTVYDSQPTADNPTGMRGRMAVFEVMEMTSAIEKIILDNPVESRIWEAARQQGMLTIKEDAMMKAFAGTTPFSEVSTLSSLLASGDEEQAEETPATPPLES